MTDITIIRITKKRILETTISEHENKFNAIKEIIELLSLDIPFEVGYNKFKI